MKCPNNGHIETRHLERLSSLQRLKGTVLDLISYVLYHKCPVLYVLLYIPQLGRHGSHGWRRPEWRHCSLGPRS